LAAWPPRRALAGSVCVGIRVRVFLVNRFLAIF